MPSRLLRLSSLLFGLFCIDVPQGTPSQPTTQPQAGCPDAPRYISKFNVACEQWIERFWEYVLKFDGTLDPWAPWLIPIRIHDGDRGGSEEPHPQAGTRAYLGGTSRRTTQHTHRRWVPGRYTREGESVLFVKDCSCEAD